MLAVLVSVLTSVNTASVAGLRDGVGGYEFKVDDQGGGGISSEPARIVGGGASTTDSERTGVVSQPQSLPRNVERVVVTCILRWMRLMWYR